MKSWDNADLWYHKDEFFNVPNALVKFKIYTKDLGFGSDPRIEVFVSMWEAVLQQKLQ